MTGRIPGEPGGTEQDSDPRSAADVTREDAETEQLVRAATTDIQDFWVVALPQQAHGTAFPRTQLVLFSDETTSACGAAEAQTGPFYCPADRLVYVDLGFYGELARRFHAPGQFAQAYVVAHELGHHVQSVLGIEARVTAVHRADRSQDNALSVLFELQADCLAGVWAYSAARRGLLEPGEAAQGLAAAAAIGDDRLQRMAGRRVARESFKHGSSDERVQWLTRGMQSGQLSACDTFGRGTMGP